MNPRNFDQESHAGCVRRTSHGGQSDSRSLVAWGLLLLIGGSSTAVAQQGVGESDASVRQWVEQLGDQDFRRREAAMLHLREVGMGARDELRMAAETADPEIRARAERLLVLIEETDFKRRLDAFAADEDGRLGVDLPGWHEFKAQIGSDAAARELFVAMQRREPGLFRSLASAPHEHRARMKQRISDLQRLTQRRPRGMQLSMGSCASLLFASSAKPIELSATEALIMLHYARESRAFKSALGDPEENTPLRRVLGNWMINCPSQDLNVRHENCRLAIRYQVPEAVGTALSLAEDPTVHVLYRATALMAVAQVGNRQHIPTLETLLDDTTPVIPSRSTLRGRKVVQHVQLRDVALAALVHLTEQNLADYGFTNVRKDAATIYDVRTLLFTDRNQRTQALTRWRQWWQAQPQPASDSPQR